MELNTIKGIIKGALTKDASVNFEDSKQAVIKALCELYNVTPDMDSRELRRHLPSKEAQFALIEEVIDEILPTEIEDIMGQWAVTKQFGRNEEVKFRIENVGKKRAQLSIVPGQRGGLYSARRLDNKDLVIKTRTYTVAVYTTLEEIIAGSVTLGELMDNILQGLTYQIYVDVVAALRTIKTLAPSANVASAAGLVVNDFDKLVRICSAYGKPVIMCFESFANNFSNVVGPTSNYNPNVPAEDLDDVRKYGSVKVYKGHPVVVIPNFITNEYSNDEWAFSEADCFIFPALAKPAYIALQGEGYMAEVSEPHGGKEMHFHKIMGCGLALVNNVCLYNDTTIAAAESGHVKFN